MCSRDSETKVTIRWSSILAKISELHVRVARLRKETRKCVCVCVFVSHTHIYTHSWLLTCLSSADLMLINLAHTELFLLFLGMMYNPYFSHFLTIFFVSVFNPIHTYRHTHLILHILCVLCVAPPIRYLFFPGFELPVSTHSRDSLG